MSTNSSRRRSRRFPSPHQPIAQTQLLSNGRYAVMMTAAGSGYSRWGDLAVTRWREDATCDGWGTYVFLRDADRGTVWSAGYQPTGVEPDSYEATFLEDRVEIVRRDGTITTKLEVTVSPEDDAEARRVTISNAGRRTREIDVTSYAEVVLASEAADTAHPAFSNLFVQTEFVADIGALLATRRRRSPDEPPVWAAHLAVVEGEVVGSAQFETDRARFLGRGRGIRTPVSVIDGRPLSNTSGAVLDPIFSLRRRIRLAPGATAHITFWTLVAASRSEVLALADKHHDAAAFERASTLAWTQAQVAAVPPRHRLGRGQPVPTPGQSRALREPGAPSFIRCPDAERGRPAGAVGARHFWRRADRRVPDRRHRGSADRPPAAPGARVLADEAVARWIW